MAKYRGATSTNAKVLRADMLNFKPILDPHLKKLVRDPHPRRGIR